MMKRTRKISESFVCFSPVLEQTKDISGQDMIKGVKVLGFVSKNKRLYSQEAIRKAANLYENAPVNIDHPTSDGPRTYESRFGKLVNINMQKDGLYGDLVFNPKHRLAESLIWFAKNAPELVGLSHNARARTRLNKDGIEEVHEITDVVSVDLVSDPATTGGLLEACSKFLESNMKKEADMPEKDKEEDLVRKLDKGTNVAMEEEPEKKDEEPKKDEEGMALKLTGEQDDDQEFDSIDSYKEFLHKKIMDIVQDEEKAKAILAMLHLDAEMEMEPEEEQVHSMPVDNKHDEKEMEDPKKAEEALRRSKSKGVRILMEELETYRLAAKKSELSLKAKKECEKAGLPNFAITESFVDILVDSDTRNWAKLLEDRKSILFQSKKPVSTGILESKLTVDSLVKMLQE